MGRPPHQIDYQFPSKGFIGQVCSKRKPCGGVACYIWSACQKCGKERWVVLKHGEPAYSHCYPCSIILHPRQRGANHYHWKGGRRSDGNGYILVYLESDDFFFPMTGKDHCVLEHRLVMAKHLGRCLQTWELVHHKGKRYIGIENRSDNLIDNLELTTNGSHSREHSKGYRDGYRQGYQDAQNALKNLLRMS